MVYKIKYYYRTGDSFHSEELEDILEFEWKDINIIKESLKRIKEHYKWYESLESYHSSSVKKPKWYNVNVSHETEERYLINLPMDNGKEIQMWCPWCGYFERLYSVEIIIDDKDIKIEF